MTRDDLLKLAESIHPRLKKFYLAGGTAIMFKHNHRESVDLDFFSEKHFSSHYYVRKLTEEFPVSRVRHFTDNTDLLIGGHKVSLVYFPFKNIRPLEKFEGIPIASDYDLFLNKIYVAGRRIDLKDPFDIAFLYDLHRWDIRQLKTDFEKKFPGQDFGIFLGAVFDTRSYPDLSAETKKSLREFEREARKVLK
ncbi:MAG: hypothetical protein GXO27_00585 [Chlorobi bacterium]|nr:hypothetical protein [Chlorobiota bacterium]